MLVLAARGNDPWQGVLVPTDRERQADLRAACPNLEVHPLLPKWLYLPESCETFEETAQALAELAQHDDPRLGVDPGVKGLTRRRRKPP